MNAIILAAIGIAGTAAAFAFGLPPPTPDLWPLAIGLISAGICGLLSTLSWCFIQLKKIEINKGKTHI